MAGKNRVPRPAAGMTALRTPWADITWADIAWADMVETLDVEGQDGSMNAVSQAKQELRTRLRAQRAARTDRMGQQFADQLLRLPELVDAQAIGAFVGMLNEPDTTDFLVQSLVPVWLPVVNVDRLSWGLFTSHHDLVPGPWGLHEPATFIDHLPETVSALVVPALAADRKGNRLGTGGGFYDRMFGDMDSLPTLIAVVFDEELIDNVPVEPFDTSMDVIVTPTQIIRI